MKAAEYFLEHREPVISDPFGVQGPEPILATYPNLVPGWAFLETYKHFGATYGLNLLRIALFAIFLATLALIVRRQWSNTSLIFQILVLAFAMTGTIVLRPDLFNYLYFTLWIYLLEKILQGTPKSMLWFSCLLLIEILWVNTHPLFFYQGLLIAAIYFVWAMYNQWRRTGDEVGLKWTYACTYLVVVGFLWIWTNPLGFSALQSLFVNMLEPGFSPGSVRPFHQSLKTVNTYGYLLLIGLFFVQRPKVPISRTLRYDVLLAALILPALIYERCLPFPCIFLILIQGLAKTSDRRLKPQIQYLYLALTVILSVLLIVDRHTLILGRSVARVNAALKIRLTLSFTPIPGIDLNSVHPHDRLREVSLLNQLAEPGNCISNQIEIGSSAVWHSPDKPFFIYGHAALMNTRRPQVKQFFGDLMSGQSQPLMEAYDIRTIVLADRTHRTYLNHHQQLNRNVQLIYMDPAFTILVRKNSINPQQRQKIREFYEHFRPGLIDRQQFTKAQQAWQYLLLWFSAEMTGNDGSFYLSAAQQKLPLDKIEKFRKEVAPLLEQAG